MCPKAGPIMSIVNPVTGAVAENSAAPDPNTSDVSQHIIALEHQWAEAIFRRNPSVMNQFLAESYFLGMGLLAPSIVIVPREQWLANLPLYITESSVIEDIRVGVYGDTAVAFMHMTQQAKVGPTGMDRSGRFMITDIWVKQEDGWRVAERHSCRAETSTA